MKNVLKIIDLHVETLEGKKILNGITLTIKPGETHAIMGPNGGGKSTLAQSLMGHPGYKITEGKIVLNGVDITQLTPDLRAKQGLFLGFQYPVEISGVNFGNFLRLALNESASAKATGGQSKKISPIAFRNKIEPLASNLGFKNDIVKRFLNQGFSGGEKKKAEILQLEILKPAFAILDEPDSGLDIDALRYIGKSIESLDYDIGLMLITHYQRILKYIKPDFVHIIVGGKIVQSDDESLARLVEEKGYENYL